VLSWLEGLLGLLIVATTLLDVFLAVVVPRRTPRSSRLGSSSVVRYLWRGWLSLSFRIESNERRETLLGTFGALAVIVLLAFWLVSLVVGYGLIFDGLKSQLNPQPETVLGSIYFAGTSLLTIGYGDIAPIGVARIVSLAAGATGLGLFALVITFLFTLYSAFQRREVAVVVLEAGAGAPPSGVTLLETYAIGGLLDDLPRVFETWQAWAAEVLDSHLAYPVLTFFRSSHDNDSWISSLGAVMDAATLVLTTIDGGPKGWAKLSLAVGGHCIEDLVQYFHLPDPRDGPQVERAEFEEACDRLAHAGFRLRDRDEAWERFAVVRSSYASRVNSLARNWMSPPAQWIGDRSPLRGFARHDVPPAAPVPASPQVREPSVRL
jgi:hypothetical protein